MKAKLLLLLCCLFAIEGWANSNDIHLLKDSRSNPMGIPIQPDESPDRQRVLAAVPV